MEFLYEFCYRQLCLQASYFNLAAIGMHFDSGLSYINTFSFNYLHEYLWMIHVLEFKKMLLSD